MSYPEDIPDVAAEGDADHIDDHNRLSTASRNIDERLHDAEVAVAGKAASGHTHSGVYDPAGSAAAAQAAASGDATTKANAAQAAAVQRANHTGTQLASTISDFSTAVRTNRLDQMTPPTGPVAMGSQKITGLGAPTASTDAVTKAYADAITAGGAGRQTAANRVAFAGDSIMRFPGDVSSVLNNGRTITNCWPTLTCMTSGQRAWHVRNAAIGGDWSDNLVARFSADVLAYSPGTVVIGIGTNDLTNVVLGTAGYSYAEWKSNIASLVTSTRAAGAVPVLCTMPPINTAVGATYKATVPKWNAWLKRYAASQGIAVIDVYAAVVDASTGDWAYGYDNGDGVHASEFGCGFIATAAKAVLNEILPPWTPILATDNSDAANLLTNGLMITDSGGTPTGWTATGTLACATDTTFCAGRYVRIGSSEACAQSETIGATVAVGDTIAVSGRARFLSASPWAQEFKVTVTFNGSTGPVVIEPMADFFGDATGTFYQEYVVPASTTSITVALSAGAGSGQVDFGQVGLFNLTAMGAL